MRRVFFQFAPEAELRVSAAWRDVGRKALSPYSRVSALPVELVVSEPLKEELLLLSRGELVRPEMRPVVAGVAEGEAALRPVTLMVELRALLIAAAHLAAGRPYSGKAEPLDIGHFRWNIIAHGTILVSRYIYIIHTYI